MPTAFVCGYDELAFGAISALLSYGYKVPDDVSVIGKNDVPSAKYFSIPLSTISHDNEKFCDLVVDCLEKTIKGEKVNDVVIETNFCVRASVGVAKK